MAHEAGVKNFIHVSALGAHPDAPSAYAQSKAAGEKAVRAFFPEAIVLRPGPAFGREGRFLTHYERLARVSPFLPLFGDGTAKCQPVYVNDIARAIAAVLSMRETQGQTFELGGPAVYSHKEILALLCAFMGVKRHLKPLPWTAATMLSHLLQFMPNPPLTGDQIAFLKNDNVVGDQSLGLRNLGVTPTALEAILPTYIQRHRRPVM